MGCKNTVFIRWNKSMLKQLAHSFGRFLQKNYNYIKIYVTRYIDKKKRTLEDVMKRNGLCTKASFSRRQLESYVQITTIVCLISFAIISQIIAIKNYHDDKEYVSQMNYYNCEKEDTSLQKRILWAISN